MCYLGLRLFCDRIIYSPWSERERERKKEKERWKTGNSQPYNTHTTHTHTRCRGPLVCWICSLCRLVFRFWCVHEIRLPFVTTIRVFSCGGPRNHHRGFLPTISLSFPSFLSFPSPLLLLLLLLLRRCLYLERRERERRSPPGYVARVHPPSAARCTRETWDRRFSAEFSPLLLQFSPLLLSFFKVVMK